MGIYKDGKREVIFDKYGNAYSKSTNNIIFVTIMWGIRIRTIS